MDILVHKRYISAKGCLNTKFYIHRQLNLYQYYPRYQPHQQHSTPNTVAKHKYEIYIYKNECLFVCLYRMRSYIIHPIAMKLR
jgi:hypothetical protein